MRGKQELDGLKTNPLTIDEAFTVAPLKTREQSFIDASGYFFIHNKVILEYCTGFGKTYQALQIILDALKIHPNEHWVIVVPTQNLIKGWMDE